MDVRRTVQAGRGRRSRSSCQGSRRYPGASMNRGRPGKAPKRGFGGPSDPQPASLPCFRPSRPPVAARRPLFAAGFPARARRPRRPPPRDPRRPERSAFPLPARMGARAAESRSTSRRRCPPRATRESCRRFWGRRRVRLYRSVRTVLCGPGTPACRSAWRGGRSERRRLIERRQPGTERPTLARSRRWPRSAGQSPARWKRASSPPATSGP